MKLRCREGDLAVIVWSVENDGALVKVIRRSLDSGPGYWLVECLQHIYGISPVTGKPKTAKPGGVCVCHDNSLRPLRGGPGRDETLEWKPVPVEAVKPPEQPKGSK